MLRPKKFRRIEIIILVGVALLLLAAGIFGEVLAIREGHWRLGLASAGIVGLGLIYFIAAKRRRPL